jgi:hypothetical protein
MLDTVTNLAVSTDNAAVAAAGNAMDISTVNGTLNSLLNSLRTAVASASSGGSGSSYPAVQVRDFCVCGSGCGARVGYRSVCISLQATHCRHHRGQSEAHSQAVTSCLTN